MKDGKKHGNHNEFRADGTMRTQEWLDGISISEFLDNSLKVDGYTNCGWWCSSIECGGCCIGENAKVTVVDKGTNRFKTVTVADVREGDEVVVSEGTAIVRFATRS